MYVYMYDWCVQEKQQRDKARMTHQSESKNLNKSGGAAVVVVPVDMHAVDTLNCSPRSSRSARQGLSSSDQLVTLLNSPCRGGAGKQPRTSTAVDVNKMESAAPKGSRRDDVSTSTVAPNDSRSDLGQMYVNSSNAREMVSSQKVSNVRPNMESRNEARWVDEGSKRRNDDNVLRRIENNESLPRRNNSKPDKLTAPDARIYAEFDDGGIPLKDGIGVMPYEEFVHSLTTRGLPIPHRVVRRSKERESNTESHHYSVYDRHQWRDVPRQGNYRTGRRHGYESDIVNDSSVRQHRSQRRSGYDSEGYRSEAGARHYRSDRHESGGQEPRRSRDIDSEVSYLHDVNGNQSYYSNDNTGIYPSTSRRASRQNRSSSDIYGNVEVLEGRACLREGSGVSRAELQKNVMLSKAGNGKRPSSSQQSAGGRRGLGGYESDQRSRTLDRSVRELTIREESYSEPSNHHRGHLHEAFVRQLRDPQRFQVEHLFICFYF